MKRAILRVGLAAFVFACGVVLGAALHVNLPVARVAVAFVVTRAIGSALPGSVRVDAIGAIGPTCVRGVRARALDPSGAQAISAASVDVDANALGVLVAWIEGAPLVLDRVRVGAADVSLERTGGELRLVRAFVPRERSEPSASKGSGVHLVVRAIEIDHAWVHGPLVDADADALRGELEVRDVPVVRARAGVRARGLPRLDPRGAAEVAVAGDHVRVLFGGEVAGAPALAGGGLDHERIFAALITPKTVAWREYLPVFETPMPLRARLAGTFSDFVLHADAPVTLDARVRDGSVEAKARGYVFASDVALDVRARSGVIEGRASARVDDLAPALALVDRGARWRGHGRVRAVGLLRGSSPLSLSADAALADVARGPVGAGSVRASASVRGERFSLDAEIARARVPHTTISDVRARASGTTREAEVHATLRARQALDLDARVALLPSASIEDARVSSGGVLIARAAAKIGPRVEVAADARELDLWRVGAILGVDFPLEGKIALSTRAVVSAEDMSGWLALDARALRWDGLRDARAHVDVAAEGGTLSGTARASSPLGWLALEVNGVRRRGGWRGHADLAGNVALEPVLGVPGFGAVHAVIDARREAPTIALTARTIGAPLALTLRADGREDGDLTARVEASREDRLVATADVATRIPWARLARGERPNARAWPLTLTARATELDTRWICAVLGIECDGELDAQAELTGTLERPRANATMTVRAFHARPSLWDAPLDATMTARFEDGRGALALDGVADGAIEARGEVRVQGSEWFVPSAKVSVRDLAVAWRGARARVSGRAEIVDLHRDARATATLEARAIDAGDTRLEHASVRGAFDGHELTASGALDARSGTLRGDLTALGAWGAELAPSIEPTEVRVRARAFPLAAVRLVAPPTLSLQGGALDADVSARLREPLEARGFAAVERGSVDSPDFGPLEDVRARVVLAGDALRLERADARRGVVGIHARGEARLVDASAKLDAWTDSGPFPIYVGGRRLGDVTSGRVAVTARRESAQYVVVVRVPTLHFELPKLAPHGLQPLEPPKDIELGVEGPDGFTTIELAPPRPLPERPPLPALALVELGDDVRVAQGDLARAKLEGKLRATFSEGARAFGAISVGSGWVDVSGKRFTIERAVATFGGDPSNPEISATASWEAPDKTKVYADYIGPLQSGKVTLRSEPARTRDEIVALLVYGTASGPGSNAAGTALGAGASIATQPLNAALRQLTQLDVRTRVETSGPNPRPEVEVQIARDLTASFAYVLGVPTPGTNPDRYWLTVGWRVGGHLTTDATIGDRGSSIVELTWHYLY